MNFELDPSIHRTMQERIAMVTHPDCPIENLLVVAEYDTDLSVVEACALNENATQEVFEVVMRQLRVDMNHINRARASHKVKSNAKFKKSFCVLPWNHAATNSNGSVRMCCQMIYGDSDMPFGDVRKEDGSSLTHADNIKDHRNAPEWKKLRKMMLEGKRHDVCKLCWDEEANGIESKRQQHNNIWNSDIANIVSNTQEDGSIDDEQFPIKYWDLRFGNKCNIKCRSCGPNDSDQWYSDWKALGLGDNFTTKDGDKLQIENVDGKDVVKKTFDWVDESPLWAYLQDNLDTTQRFYFTGGEPTINNTHRQLLQYMIDNNRASEVTLEYNTNMAAIPSGVFKQWGHFKEVNIGMSIDGLFEHFEYIRNPGKWAAVERNLKRIDTDTNLSNTTASFTVTTSIMNVVHVLDMIWWLKEQKFSRINKNLVSHNLYYPLFYNITNLPPEIKTAITNVYERFINEIHRRWPNDTEWCRKAESTLRSILTHMNSTEWNPSEYMAYFTRQDALDKIRNENWRESLKGLADLITYYEQSKARSKKLTLDTASKKKVRK